MKYLSNVAGGRIVNLNVKSMSRSDFRKWFGASYFEILLHKVYSTNVAIDEMF